LREAVGLRSFREQVSVAGGEKKKAAKAARFVSFRDEDGSFRFRLLDAAGEQLLLSVAFAEARPPGRSTSACSRARRWMCVSRAPALPCGWTVPLWLRALSLPMLLPVRPPLRACARR